jgi:ketosteroid isomerase-like protein
MPEESTTPDLVVVLRSGLDAHDRQDIDAIMRLYAPDVVYDLSVRGLGIFEGAAAVCGFLEDYFAAFEHHVYEEEEVALLGNGVVFGVVSQHARPVGVAAPIHMREGLVCAFSTDGLLKLLSVYADIDEARSVAERLAAERG